MRVSARRGCGGEEERRGEEEDVEGERMWWQMRGEEGRRGMSAGAERDSRPLFDSRPFHHRSTSGGETKHVIIRITQKESGFTVGGLTTASQWCNNGFTEQGYHKSVTCFVIFQQFVFRFPVRGFFGQQQTCKFNVEYIREPCFLFDFSPRAQYNCNDSFQMQCGMSVVLTQVQLHDVITEILYQQFQI